MPRKPRLESETGLYHFINRGVNKRDLFHEKDDYRFYLDLLKEYKVTLGLKIYHYCLMTNHTHLLLQSADLSSLSRFGHFVQRRYAYYYCKTYKWPEQVFRKRFISLPVEKESYLLECGRYIERNPVAAGLVNDLKEYPYSSFSYYAFNKPIDFLDESPLYETLGRNTSERQNAYRLYVTLDRDGEASQRDPF